MPVITKPNQHFDATTYTGNGSNRSIVNDGSMQPDFVWMKRRDGSGDHNLFDSVRGATKDLYSNGTFAETTFADSLTAFNSNGFSLGTDASGNYVNTNGHTMVAWQWKAGGTAVTNTSGTISSQVSANPTAGFSVVTYTGTGANATVGHGLGVAPSMIIVKRRDAGGSGWSVYFTTLAAGNVLSLQSTNAASSSPNRFTTTLPTSTVFSIGTDSDLNASGGTYVAYCFAQVAGYSAFGNYTGNGSADGPFVYLGFRPRFVLIKRSDTSSDWTILDTARDTYNGMFKILYPDSSSSEDSSSIRLDSVSNGFKIRISSASSNYNASGGTYIYMAFAESPFKYANAR